jgi:hypothetical protein
MTTSAHVSAIADCIAAIAALFAVVLAGQELRKTRRAFKQSALASLLGIEADVANRRAALSEINFRRNTESDQERQGHLDQLKAVAIENYLNALDRIAFCIRHKYLSEKQFRSEYERLFQESIECWDDFFGDGSCYDNILFLAKRWHLRLTVRNCDPEPQAEPEPPRDCFTP